MFDKDAKYEDIRALLIKSFNEQYDKYVNGQSVVRSGRTLIYIITEMIQLFNGSLIGEAVNAFLIFFAYGYDEQISVNLSRSNTKTRTILFPVRWLQKNHSIMDQLKISHPDISHLSIRSLSKAIYDHLQLNFNIGSLSLRYAHVDFMIRVRGATSKDVANKIGLDNDRPIMKFIYYKREIGDYVTRDAPN